MVKEYDVSGCVFVKDTFKGAFCLFESIAMVLPLVKELIVLDLGSTDGTFERLKAISVKNDKIKLFSEKDFPKKDAGVFADLANWLVKIATYDNVLYFQADEIFHEDLVQRLSDEFEKGNFDLSFWRIQYRENFQKVKWFPHPVHRVGNKKSFNFVGDGMNTDRYLEPPVCSSWGMDYFTQWGDMGQTGIVPYTNEMITDISLVGGFLDNIPDRRRMHLPFWNEEPEIEGLKLDDWYNKEKKNENWKKEVSPYMLPAILKPHLGKQKYYLSEELFRAICNNDTKHHWNVLKLRNAFAESRKW